MSNKELIAKIKAEIERRKLLLTQHSKLTYDLILETFIKEYDDLLSFLSTLESETTYDTQQYIPRPSVGIDDVARVQFASHAKVFDKKRKAVFDWEQFKEVAGIFYGFGKKDHSDTLESEKPVSNDLEERWDELQTNFREINEAFEAGKKEQKEQMMKAAVKWLVDDDYHELSEKGRFILGSVGLGYNGYYIPYSDLLKLPNEDEKWKSI